MTMEIRVENKDHFRTGEIIEEEFNIGEVSPSRSNKIILQPLEVRSFWIHTSKRLVISEAKE